MREHLGALGFLLRVAFSSERWRTVAALTLYPLSRVLFPLVGLWSKLLLDGVREQNAAKAQTAGLLLVASLVGGWFCDLISWRLCLSLDDRIGFALQKRLFDLTTRLTGIEQHETPAYLDKIQLIRENERVLSSAFYTLPMHAADVARALTVFALLGAVHPLLLLLPLFAVPTLLVSSRLEWRNHRAEVATAERMRLGRHLFETATSASAGKELRVFGLGSEIVSRHRGVLESGFHDRLSVRYRGTVGLALAWTLFGAGFVAAIALVLVRVRHGDATPGTLLLALTVATQVNLGVAGLAGTVNWLHRTVHLVGQFLWLERYAAKAGDSPGAPSPVPSVIRSEISFENVTFRYPGADDDVLVDFSAVLPRGATVALVGENGAGKTSLVKLLCGFYAPTSGTIRVDGVGLETIDQSAWKGVVSACFQDFAKFEFVARESVGVGDLPQIEDGAAIDDALARAGASSVLSALPNGLETELGKMFGGTDLSIGQWQKLALGRAMMRRSPLLLVLDEPTASLDAETEHALFERYAGAARRVAQSNGGITLLVSHRFSTVRMADLIMVLEKGRLREAGSHAELMARRGVYAELYELQARAYR
jgi:ATP-binding cassette subfamily B protein